MLPGKGKHGFKKSGKGSSKVSGGSSSSSSAVSRSKDGTFKCRSRDNSIGDLPGPSDDKVNVTMSLPLFKTCDNSRLLPRYTAVLMRSEEEGVRMEDLDVLQLELESLLSCAAVRNRVLRDEIKLLESAEEKRDRRVSNMLSASSSSSSTPAAAAAAAPGVSGVSKLLIGKRNTCRSDERPMKKHRDTMRGDSRLPAKITRVKGPSGVSGQLDLPVKDSPKSDRQNDTLNKFWMYVEPYCADITQDDINYLENLIRSREEDCDNDLYKIPPLGKHYSVKWAEQDLSDLKVGLTDEIGGTTGPLTQRLLSALIDEKVSPLQESNDNKPGRELSSHRAAAVRNIQSTSFERRVRKELKEQGIVDCDETAGKDQSEDELLMEMERLQTEREALMPHNQDRLRHLLSLATAELHRQELKQKLKIMDSELVNLSNWKQKQKPFSKKEKEQAWKLIKDREMILKQLYVKEGGSG